MTKQTTKTFYIRVGVKKYPLTVHETGFVDPEDGEIVRIECPILRLDQEYCKDDLPTLFMDIEGMIREELEQKADAHLHIRLKQSEKMLIEEKAHSLGFSSIADFVKTSLLA